jgi:hypothetical protein
MVRMSGGVAHKPNILQAAQNLNKKYNGHVQFSRLRYRYGIYSVRTCTLLFILCKFTLKVLTNEKREGLRVISFDRSPFKLFSRKFSKESVQAPSCERHKTTQRTLFLFFANNY